MEVKIVEKINFNHENIKNMGKSQDKEKIM
jgi:hypothetical protein